MISSKTPIEMDITSSVTDRRYSLRLFTSYSFDRNMLVPASPFRFTAEGVDFDDLKGVKSGDLVELYLKNTRGSTVPLATGFIDETDAATSPQSASYVITGRDTLGQLVDNAAVDKNNKIIHGGQAKIDMLNIAELLRKNTRIPGPVQESDTPNGKLLFQTNPGETKINALQRYMEFTNCITWTLPNGLMVVGKPDMAQRPSGKLILMRDDPSGNNLLECRARRAANVSIREIAVILQTLSITDPAPVTLKNQDDDVFDLTQGGGVGKSVLRTFSFGNGTDAVNTGTGVGTFSPQQAGFALARREIARSNMDVLRVTAVVRDHVNEDGNAYNVDQVYTVQYENGDVSEDMYVYSCKYDLTKEHGRITTLDLVKLGTIVADVKVLF